MRLFPSFVERGGEREREKEDHYHHSLGTLEGEGFGNLQRDRGVRLASRVGGHFSAGRAEDALVSRCCWGEGLGVFFLMGRLLC